jgi:hypothetical protein
MTTHEHDDRDDDVPTGGMPIDRDRIARELAALGEPPPDDAELDWVGAADDGHPSVDVATTRALFSVAGSHAEVPSLSVLDRRRVWKRLAGRIESLEAERRESDRGHGPRRALLAALAMAAGVVLVTRLAPIGQAPAVHSAESRATTEALGARARASLDALGGEVDGARARTLADDYASRLRVEREGT